MQIDTTSPLFHLWAITLWFLLCCSLPLSSIASNSGSSQQQEININ